MSTSENEIDSRIPINIITGFLGSGKTTLLNAWVNTPEFKDTLVLINEFGDVGLDHELVQAVDDTVVLLGSGCICCTLQGELIQSLASNLINSRQGKIPAFKRVLIETTGLADPAGVISTLNNDDFCLDNFRYDGTITILDGQFVRQQVEKQYEAVKQIALADIILISKVDLIDPEEMDAIAQMAKHINHSARVLPVIKGQVTPKIIEEIGPYKSIPTQDPKKIKLWLNLEGVTQPEGSSAKGAAASADTAGAGADAAGAANADAASTSECAGEGAKEIKLAPAIRPASVDFTVGMAKPKIIAHTNIESFAIVHHEPISPLALLAAVNNVQQQYGDSILRMKGIVEIEGQDKPVIIHGVQGQLYPITDLEEWPDGERASKIVFIVRATVLEQIKHIFTQTLEHPDEGTISYYQQIISRALEGQDDEYEVEEIELMNNVAQATQKKD